MPLVLGSITLSERAKVMKDKHLGTTAKPIDAQVIDDGRGTLTFLVPATGLPGVKLCVKVPDGRLMYIDVPMDANIGDSVYFTAPPPAAADGSGAGAGEMMRDGDELYRNRREPPRITVAAQAYALVAKNASIQFRQHRTNQCPVDRRQHRRTPLGGNLRP